MSSGALGDLTGYAVLTAAGERLEGAGIDSGQGDAMRLMAHAFGDLPRHELRDRLRDPLPPDVAERFAAAINARMTHQPVSQIIGYRPFWNHRFRVTQDTLDPRPDTETLVAEALKVDFTRLLDLGTGTGAIAISLLADRPEATGVAVDLSDKALAVARQNAVRIGVDSRLVLTRSDWFDGVTGRFDLIVSNPPYIAQDEMPGLAADVREWEPRMALTDEGDGLGAYRIITKAAPGFLHPGGRLMVEIGPTQGAAVLALFEAAGFVDNRVLPDLDGRDRVVSGCRPR